MKCTSSFAIGIALALCGVSVAAPAYAAQEVGQAERKYAFSDAARPALAELQKAMQGTDAAAFQAALATAQAAAQTSADTYVIEQFPPNQELTTSDEDGEPAPNAAMIPQRGDTPAQPPTPT